VEASGSFAELVLQQNARLDIGTALIAAQAHPGLDIGGVVTTFDELAAACPSSDLDGLCSYLFDDCGFVGNTVDYYDPENSFIDTVLLRRTGIPITLSVVLIEVGRRIGLDLVGVGLPGHFVVRDAHDTTRLIDPFNGGRRLDEAGCEAMLSQLQGRQVTLHPSWLAAVDHRAILWRVLTNLKGSYAQRNTLFELTWVLSLRCQFPDAPESEFEEARRANAIFN
jgi:regulator of sirC expression with transglutaminase-like and TPR domain